MSFTFRLFHSVKYDSIKNNAFDLLTWDSYHLHKSNFDIEFIDSSKTDKCLKNL